MALAPKFRNWLRTLGAPEDPVATDTSSEWSAMSLLKAIYGKISDGSLAAGIASSAESQIRTAVASATAQGNQLISRARAAKIAAEAAADQAQGFLATVTGFVSQCAQFRRQTRADAIATAADAVSTAADVVTASDQAAISLEASHRTAGMAMLGDRARKAQVAAAASQVATAADAVLTAADVVSTANSAGQAQGFMAAVQGIVSQVANYMRLARASAVATTADAAATAADVVTVNAQTSVALDASNRAAGYSMSATRAGRSEIAALAAQVAAEAAAASVPSAEQLVLPVQIFS